MQIQIQIQIQIYLGPIVTNPRRLTGDVAVNR